MNNENKDVITSLCIKQSPGPNEFTVEVSQIFKEVLILAQKSSLTRKERKGTLPSSSYEARIILIPKIDKEHAKKKTFLIKYLRT